jgi:DNA helicase-2/ATP-dependent DNA helicase PcrA
MRERLREYIGATAYRVPIHTFHGFAQSLISQYPDAYEKVIGGRPANDLEKINLIETILSGGEVKALRPMGNPAYYISPIMRTIGVMKQENVSPDGLVAIVSQQQAQLQEIEQFHTKGPHQGKVRGEYADLEKKIIKNTELAYVYRQYEALLRERGLFDFDDMILETVRALESDESMLRDLQERYLYVLADEHQDVNGAQNRILELLTSFHARPNIFAVGDEKQAIYRFQGASLDNFLYFKEHFQHTKEIQLTENYRSGQTILDVAHSLVESDDELLQALRVPLEAKAVADAKVERRQFSHQLVENEWLASAIKGQVEAGTSPEEIAVIVRTNREVEALSQSLRKEGLAVTASADGDILHHPIMGAVRSLIDAVVSTKSEEALFKILHGSYWGIDTNDLIRVTSARSYHTTLHSIISDSEHLTRLKVVNAEPILRVASVLEEARTRDTTESPHRVLEYLIQESGLLNHLITHDPFEGTRVVRRIYDEIEEMVLRDGVHALGEIGETLQARAEHHLPLNAPYITTNTKSVQVMTAHKSKGLEFKVVYVPHLTDRGWSGSNKRTYFSIPLSHYAKDSDHEVIEDERRLLYVAMTRAKEELHLSASDTDADAKEFVPSRLFEDISPGLMTEVDTTEAEAQFSVSDALQKSVGRVVIDENLLATLLAERGFSATSLNNYLRSPWDYLYRNVMRIPEVQPTHMQYGTAVHNTLEYITRKHTDKGSLPTVTEIKQRLEVELGRLPLTVDEFTRLLEKGMADITLYLEHLKATLPKSTKEEMAITVSLKTGIDTFPEVTLTGKLDRLDLSEDGRVLRVVDYKTGKPKTRNAIEGKTKSEDGGYKRQLIFYALLLELYDDDRYHCREGVLSFVQAKANGVIVEEAFIITDEEIEALKAEIISVTQAIINGTFLSDETGESEYQDLVKLLLANQEG